MKSTIDPGTSLKRVPWRDQIVNGRVFELRSSSKRYPPPCALVVDDTAKPWARGIFRPVDHFGVIGYSLYERNHNPNIYVPGIKREDFPRRIRCRRRDLERFDADDLALLRFGLSLDFNGYIHGRYGDEGIPPVVPSEWTAFWLTASDDDDYRAFDLWHDPVLMKLLAGAWYINNHGGSRRLGYEFGHLWATRHHGERLNEIRQFLRARLNGIIEQPVKIVRWRDGENTYLEEIRRECPALGYRFRWQEVDRGVIIA